MKIRLVLLLFVALFAVFFSCQSEPKKTAEDKPEFSETTHLERGQSIAAATFTALSGKLQAAMKDGGVPNAVEYCNLAAMPLVDSLSKVHQADIRRTSFKVRNPKDSPTPLEEKVLKEYESTFNEGGKLGPIVQELEDGKVAFYAPIMVNAFCLQCHGKVGETLKEEDYKFIKNQYPADQAIGYSEGDFRGMWSIQFND